MKNTKRLLVIFAAALITWITNADTASLRNEGGAYEAILSDLVTNYRLWLKLPRYEASEKLEDIAEAYAKEMAENKFFSHTEVDWTNPANRASIWWYKSIEIWENIAHNFFTSTQPEEIFKWWISSPWHELLLRSTNYNEVWYGYRSWYRVMMVWLNQKLQMISSYEQCDRAIKENTAEYRFENRRPECLIEWVDSIPSTITIKKTIPVKTTTVVKPLMVWKVTEAQFLINMNKIYSKYLNGKKLYLK
jgi:hypothetical protein